MVLERGTNPTLSRRTCSPRYGLQSSGSKSAAGVAKRPRERSPTRNPNVSIRTCSIAACSVACPRHRSKLTLPLHPRCRSRRGLAGAVAASTRRRSRPPPPPPPPPHSRRRRTRRGRSTTRRRSPRRRRSRAPPRAARASAAAARTASSAQTTAKASPTPPPVRNLPPIADTPPLEVTHARNTVSILSDGRASGRRS
jgi:hypothetical protein